MVGDWVCSSFDYIISFTRLAHQLEVFNEILRDFNLKYHAETKGIQIWTFIFGKEFIDVVVEK